jgi:hypothetical protein
VPLLKNACTCVDGFPTSIILPWSQLTTLVADKGNAQELMMILPSFTSLETLTLGNKFRDLIELPPLNIQLDRLRELILWDGYSIRLFKSMTLPPLVSLTLWSLSLPALEALHGFLSTSKFQIDTLDLGFVNLDTAFQYWFIETLFAATTVRKLCISFGNADSIYNDERLLYFIRTLLMRRGGLQTVRGLQELDILCDVGKNSKISFIADEFMEMVAWRNRVDLIRVRLVAWPKVKLIFPGLTKTGRLLLGSYEGDRRTVSISWKNRGKFASPFCPFPDYLHSWGRSLLDAWADKCGCLIPDACSR